MRKIKFRAWSPNRNGFVDDCYPIGTSKGITITLSGVGEGDDCQDTEDDGLVIQQYTGLRDKNGKEIYEGDIVSYTRPVGNWTGKTMTSISKIYFEPRICAFVMDSVGDYTKLRKHHFYIYEVLGNIYENPELLT